MNEHQGLVFSGLVENLLIANFVHDQLELELGLEACGCRVFSLCGHKRGDLDDVRVSVSLRKSGSQKVRVCQSWSQRSPPPPTPQ